MRIALVDLGSASLRAEVYEISNKTKVISRIREMPRLGQGLYTRGILPEEAKHSTLSIFRHLNSHFSELGVDRVYAVATSALREAEDGPGFIEELSAEFSWPVRILSGKEEAQLIARGITENEDDLPSPALFIDIGGGSTEISVYSDGEVLASESLPLGAIRYTNTFLKEAPPSDASLCALNAEIEERLMQNATLLSYREDLQTAIGTSGTARAVSALVAQTKESLKPCSLDDVRQLRSLLSGLGVEQIDRLPGMQRNRADIILAGTVILDVCLTFFGVRNFQACRFSLRHGLLANAIAASTG